MQDRNSISDTFLTYQHFESRPLLLRYYSSRVPRGVAWDRLGIAAQEDTLSLRTDLYWTESQLHLTTSANPSYDLGLQAAGRAATAPSTKLEFNHTL